MKFQALLKEFVFWISITRNQINRIHCINSFVTMPTRQLTVDTTKIDGICTTFIYFAFFLFQGRQGNQGYEGTKTDWKYTSGVDWLRASDFPQTWYSLQNKLPDQQTDTVHPGLFTIWSIHPLLCILVVHLPHSATAQSRSLTFVVPSSWNNLP